MSISSELQPWIDWLALQREDAEDALVNAAERFMANEAFERLDTKGKLSERQ